MNRKQRRAESKQGDASLHRATQSFDQAVQQHQAGHLSEAVALYRQAIGFKPDFANAFYNQGVALQTLGRIEDAVGCYTKATHFKPDLVEAHYNLGLAALGQDTARTGGRPFLRRATALKGDHADAHYNLGITLRQQGRLEDAIECYHRAIAARPGFANAHYNLGILLLETNHPDEAAACYQRAIDLQPDYGEAHYNLGVVTHQQGRPADAIGSYRKALALRPDYPEAHTSLATALLLLGEMAEGWEEFEWRWLTRRRWVAERREFAQPQWRGEPAEGKTLLIHAEQGFGDTIQFCRYAALAASRGLRVIMEVQAPLLRLLAGLPGVDHLVAQGETLPRLRPAMPHDEPPSGTRHDDADNPPRACVPPGRCGTGGPMANPPRRGAPARPAHRPGLGRKRHQDRRPRAFPAAVAARAFARSARPAFLQPAKGRASSAGGFRAHRCHGRAA